jgi:DNA invertase Pin-like site-specific DNA recombinase
MSDKIGRHHLQRKAILYVRQSSSHQVIHNVESRRLQYAMRERLTALGWQHIEVVDEDLGRSAAGASTRKGFERMVADVCLGKVGAVAAREVSRFARNSREWQQLVEVCRLVDTVLIDQEVVYAPRLSNDRLLLGLKGSLNEYELDLLRQRSLEARYEKARRGELVVSAPIGYIKTRDQKLEKDPDRRVQERIQLVFRKLLELGSVRQTLMWFLEEDLHVPARGSDGRIAWKRPRYGAIQSIVTNPTYAGAYVFGRTEHGSRYENGQVRRVSRRRRPKDWISLIQNHHEGYIEWKRYEQIQAMIANNCLGSDRPGPAKKGAALLAGILRCRRCGRKITVAYTGGDHRFLRYTCVRGRLDSGEPKCISFGGMPVDDRIAQEVLHVVQPTAVAAAVEASRDVASQRDAVLDALNRDLEAARYAAQRAQRQYDAADPDYRLVADELERRWNTALEHLQDIENRVEQHHATTPLTAPASTNDFAELAEDLEAVWSDPNTEVRLKKRIVRALIREVIAEVDSVASEVVLLIHWHGGAHTELRVPRRKRGSAMRTAPNIIDAVRILARVSNDRMIAGFLNRNDLRTGRGNRWTQMRVTSLRTHHKIPNYSAETKDAEGWMNLTEAAAFLGLSSRTLRLAVERGDLPGKHPLDDGPWVFLRSDLESDAAKRVVRGAHRPSRNPAVPESGQQELDFSST